MAEKKQIQLKVTTLKDLKQYNEGALVELPPFGVEQPFVARIKMPSILGLASKGKFINELLGVATDLFLSTTSVDKDEPKILESMCQVFTVLAQECLVSPTYDEITESGLQLTDEQLMFIFNYSQQGVKALESFRKK